MAAALHMTRILVPPAPGLFSAFGLLYADVEHHYSRTFRRVLAEADPGEIDRAWRALEEEGRAQLEIEGFPAERMRFRRTANLHYKGQIYELSVAAPPTPADGGLDRAWLDRLADLFGEEHERTYGHRAGPEEPVELVNMVLVAEGLPDAPVVPDTLHLDRSENGAGGGRAQRLLRPREGLDRDARGAALRPCGRSGRPAHRRGVRRHLSRPARRRRLPRRLRQHRPRPLTAAG